MSGVSRVQGEKDTPLTYSQAQFTRTVFEGLHIAVACGAEPHQGRIDPRLDDAIKVRQIAHRLQVEKLRGGSQPELASDFVQGDIVARFRAGQIQLGGSLGIEDFLFTQFR